MIRRVLRVLASLSLLFVFACASPPAPVEPPSALPPPPPVGSRDEKVIGKVRVTASALNVRSEASSEGEVITQVKKGTSLDVLADDDGSWTKVRLSNGETGWVASRFVSTGKVETAKKKKSGCESDYAFTETPTVAFSDRARPGMVVVEASVNTKGTVTKTKVVSNTTGEESLAFLAEREIKSAKFSPPMRNCVPRAFIFTYRRTF
jgi:uncharacterized protein YgiM (DUF1202 family)